MISFDLQLVSAISTRTKVRLNPTQAKERNTVLLCGAASGSRS